MKNAESAYFEFLLLLTGNESLSKQTAAELAWSDNDPSGFFSKHEEQFSERGIVKTICIRARLESRL